MASRDTDYEFKDQALADGYKCGICMETMVNPVATCNQHMACQTCVQTYWTTPPAQLTGTTRRKFKCHLCRQWCLQKDASSVHGFTQRKINDLVISCVKGASLGVGTCGWTGTMDEWPEHANQCLYEITPCPWCKNEFLLRDQIGHSEQCALTETFCPKACGAKMLRNAVGAHLRKQCENARVCFLFCL